MGVCIASPGVSLLLCLSLEAGYGGRGCFGRKTQVGAAMQRVFEITLLLALCRCDSWGLNVGQINSPGSVTGPAAPLVNCCAVCGLRRLLVALALDEWRGLLGARATRPVGGGALAVPSLQCLKGSLQLSRL